ncbi:hypothetical protein DPMN_160182 [Dreissena polymorpha]|uniref:Uncharacterized protein n=1 Tax=Dreissena polymorpha TaxID=45954 RepID=A0A9D4IRE3_DREPO|nr:hypothetical protein DPMN_160182 [Dreissena polymorpha]
MTGLSSSRQRYTRLESNSVFSTCHSHIQLGDVPIFFTVEPTLKQQRIRRKKHFDVPSPTPVPDVQPAKRSTQFDL